ncbi:MAG: DUF507 family protein [Acidobacteria bacterium]|nr:MAG: DUF507 family protein [Acidobacteriota bacterium]
MQLTREYVAYMSKELMKRLTGEGLVQFDQPEYVNEVMLQVVLDELTVEDRINDEARRILEEHADQMKVFGATYEDAFKAIKKQIIRERRIVI